MVSTQGDDLQTICLGIQALRDSPEPRHAAPAPRQRRQWRQRIPRCRRLAAAAPVPPPSPGAQGDVCAGGDADNSGKWAVPRTPMAVAHGPGRCCPRQAEASGLSQPRPHVAGTLLFVLVPWEASLASPGTRDRKRRHLTGRSRAWGQQALAPLGCRHRVRHQSQRGTGWAVGLPEHAQGRRPVRGEPAASLA